MIGPDEIGLPPWQRYSWHGQFVSLDVPQPTNRPSLSWMIPAALPSQSLLGVSPYVTTRATSSRVKSCAGQTWWGPTGSGFCDDAYGGDTDIWFAHDADTLLLRITESARELLQ